MSLSEKELYKRKIEYMIRETALLTNIAQEEAQKYFEEYRNISYENGIDLFIKKGFEKYIILRKINDFQKTKDLFIKDIFLAN
jgi:hypothetical protein